MLLRTLPGGATKRNDDTRAGSTAVVVVNRDLMATHVRCVSRGQEAADVVTRHSIYTYAKHHRAGDVDGITAGNSR